MPSADQGAGEAFRKIGERERFDGHFFKVVTATFVGPDGFTFEREIVRHPGAVCAVPLEEDRNHVLMVRQFRAAAGSGILELPAGKRDVEGEDPRECMARELAEEIGQQAAELTEIARFYNSVGFNDEMTICYLAEGLVECERDAHGIEEEHMTIERVSLDEIEELMASGDLVDAKSIVGLFAARSALAGARPATNQPSFFGAE
ncbi:MAG TPA: NUDIX hydrolase [Acidimicrobiales bacterium]|nr:NUDIX hydrolase [Acidimicrobiales bacterium]